MTSGGYRLIAVADMRLVDGKDLTALGAGRSRAQSAHDGLQIALCSWRAERACCREWCVPPTTAAALPATHGILHLGSVTRIRAHRLAPSCAHRESPSPEGGREGGGSPPRRGKRRACRERGVCERLPPICERAQKDPQDTCLRVVGTFLPPILSRTTESVVNTSRGRRFINNHTV
jgi:hypothetical protein